MWVFSCDLKEESEAECLAERGEDFQITGPILADINRIILLDCVALPKIERDGNKPRFIINN